jgi:drug/metabolite transporter (DMT)-like permease
MAMKKTHHHHSQRATTGLLLLAFISQQGAGAHGFQPSSCTTASSTNKQQQRHFSKSYAVQQTDKNKDKQVSLLVSHSSSYFSRLYTKTQSGGDESSMEETKKNDDKDNNNVLRGRALLCLVALLYGTLNVSLRLVYQVDAVPPTAAALSAARGWLASLCFVPFVAAYNNNNKMVDTSKNDSDEKQSLQTRTSQKSSSSSSSSSSVSSSSWISLLKVGAELALWNFLAQGLLNIGLLSTASARASFLTQTSVLFTPILSLVFGKEAIRSTVWIGCAVALYGLTILSGGGVAAATAAAAPGSSSSLLAFSQGDWFVLGGALSWSCYLFRLPRITSATSLDEIPVQAVKTLLLAILYSIWFVGSLWSSAAAGTAMSFAWATHLVAWAALLYSAFGPGTLADVLQQQGQQHVSASEANVLLSMEPVFAALCAWLLLGEVTTMQESMGGALILVAALIATR